MFQLDSFFPRDLKICRTAQKEKNIEIELESWQKYSRCPICGEPSDRRHSSYYRSLKDQSILNNKVLLSLSVRKFFCDNENCERKIFTERFSVFIESYARRTDRLEKSLRDIAFSCSSRGSNRLSKSLSMEVSTSSFLRIIRKTTVNKPKELRVIGVDDFAYKKGKKYGTIICDHEKKKVVDIFPERTSEALENWLKNYPGVVIATRDRAESYAKGLRKGVPNSQQIADRFHLVANLLEALKNIISRLLPKRIHIGYTLEKKDPPRRTVLKGERLEKLKKKQELVKKAKELRLEGKPTETIAKIIKRSRNTVAKYLSMEEDEVVLCKGRANKDYEKYKDEIGSLLEKNIMPSEIYKAVCVNNFVTFFFEKLRRALHKKMKNDSGVPENTKSHFYV